MSKEIKLSKGQLAIVDDQDFEFLNQWKWHTKTGRKTCYARRWNEKMGGKQTPIGMHRLLLGVTARNIYVDHKDGNGLNNQRSNLRIATHQQNCANRVRRSNKTSKYIGVSRWKNRKKWRAQIIYNYKKIHLGTFEVESDAAIAYDVCTKRLNGEFASLNFK